MSRTNQGELKEDGVAANFVHWHFSHLNRQEVPNRDKFKRHCVTPIFVR